MGELEIRPLDRAGLDVAVGWAAAEGWNPGLADGDAFWAADPGGFWGGWLDGEPVATLSAVRYGSGYAFVGLYIVAPDHRGEGHGLALWRHVIDGLGPRALGLDGVVAQEATYARDGFRTAWRNARRQLDDGRALTPTPDSVDLAEVPLDALAADDRRVFPAERRAFLAAWRSMPGAAGRAILDGDPVAAGSSALRGWVVARPCGEGTKVGPLVADDPEVADTLLRDVVAATRRPGPVFLDVPGGNPAAVALADRYGMATVFETVRMYRGDPPPVEDHRLYGVTTFELG